MGSLAQNYCGVWNDHMNLKGDQFMQQRRKVSFMKTFKSGSVRKVREERVKGVA